MDALLLVAVLPAGLFVFLVVAFTYFRRRGRWQPPEARAKLRRKATTTSAPS